MEEIHCREIANLNYYNHEQSNRVYDINYIAPTIRTKYDDAGGIKILIPNEQQINENDRKEQR